MAEFLEGVVDDSIVFLSRHRSSMGVPAFTVHPEGNWSDEALFGGRPKELSMAFPYGMSAMLRSIKALNKEGIAVTYEATHHGPFLSRPSLFVELGGNEQTICNEEYARLLAGGCWRSR